MTFNPKHTSKLLLGTAAAALSVTSLVGAAAMAYKKIKKIKKNNKHCKENAELYAFEYEIKDETSVAPPFVPNVAADKIFEEKMKSPEFSFLADFMNLKNTALQILLSDTILHGYDVSNMDKENRQARLVFFRKNSNTGICVIYKAVKGCPQLRKLEADIKKMKDEQDSELINKYINSNSIYGISIKHSFA